MFEYSTWLIHLSSKYRQVKSQKVIIILSWHTFSYWFVLLFSFKCHQWSLKQDEETIKIHEQYDSNEFVYLSHRSLSIIHSVLCSIIDFFSFSLFSLMMRWVQQTKKKRFLFFFFSSSSPSPPLLLLLLLCVLLHSNMNVWWTSNWLI